MIDKQLDRLFKEAGKLMKNVSFSDEELTQAIECSNLVLTYLTARGAGWDLAANTLRQDVYQLETLQHNRGLKQPEQPLGILMSGTPVL